MMSLRMRLWPPPRRVELSAVAQPSRDPLPPQRYRIVIRRGAATVEANDDAGRRYANATLSQLRTTHGDALPDGVIEESPQVAVRGVMLDVSRCRVPSVDTFKSLFARLAAWKINHVELYLEHTFAYAGHDEAARWTPRRAPRCRGGGGWGPARV